MFCALLGQISGERLQDHWSSGFRNTSERLPGRQTNNRAEIKVIIGAHKMT